jgi:3-methylcrotonyl-CoA carboxylase alpha subunit
MVKASAGGGGKGIRKVEREDELDGAIVAAAREAQAAFGDGRLLIEKFVTRPRHVEVQVAGDRHGNIVHLFERDCSVQRSNQKLLEEAPAPNLSETARRPVRLCAAARARDFLRQSRHGRVPGRCGDGGRVLPGDEHAPPGRASRHRGDHRARSRRMADPDRGRRGFALGASEITCTGHAIEARLTAERADEGFGPIRARSGSGASLTACASTAASRRQRGLDALRFPAGQADRACARSRWPPSASWLTASIA